MQFIRKNFALKVIAVTLAVVGWAYVRFGGSSATGRFDQLSIPITVVNLPAGFVALFKDREAVVTVESKPGGPPVKPDDIKAVLNLSNRSAGIYNVPVQLVARDIIVQSLSPASVTLTIEALEQKSFPVVVHYAGSALRSVVVGKTKIAPAVVTIRAPTSLLAQIVMVQANIALPNEPKNLDEMVRPVAVDVSGAEIGGVSVAPNLVRVQLQFLASTTR